jgi:hypothetical protein
MRRKQTIGDELMAEVILYGGLPVRRCDVYADALARLRTHIGRDNGGRPVTEKDCHREAERFAFGLQTVTIDAVPLSREELEQLP